MSKVGVPNEAARQQFVAKLNAFRSSLEADEQGLLDELVRAAHHALAQEDVQPFWSDTLNGADLHGYGMTGSIWTTPGQPGAMTKTPFS
jgi:hypothetical protein